MTERGVSVAVLFPAPRKSLYERLVAEGKLIPAQESMREWLREHPPQPARSGLSASELLEEQREERL